MFHTFCRRLPNWALSPSITPEISNHMTTRTRLGAYLAYSSRTIAYANKTRPFPSSLNLFVTSPFSNNILDTCYYTSITSHRNQNASNHDRRQRKEALQGAARRRRQPAFEGEPREPTHHSRSSQKSQATGTKKRKLMEQYSECYALYDADDNPTGSCYSVHPGTHPVP
jgi:hypothetical protein